MELRNNYNYRQEIAQAPLRVIHQQTKQIVASALDSRKLLLTDTLLHRDWRGLAEKADLDASVIRSSKISSTEHCLHIWTQKGAFIKDFWEALESIDRYDVIDDTLQLIYNDYDNSMSRDVLGLRPIPPPSDELQASISDFDSNVLTTDDQNNLNDGGTLQFYHALVIFADEDLDFVDTMVQKLEGEYNLKLLLKDRDLIGGLAFEFSAIMRLIEERCARVIVVLSPAFLKSNVNKFFTQFAQALSIDKRRRIVIPCMYKPCQKPSEISFYHSLDYFRTEGYWDYWKKLADSIVYKQSDARWPNTHSRPVIRDVFSSAITLPSSTLPLPSPSSAITLPSSTLPLPSPSSSTFPLPSPPSSVLSTTPPVSSHSNSQGVFERIRRKTGEWVEKRNSKQKENTQESKISAKKDENSDKRTSSADGFFIPIPKSSTDAYDSDSMSNSYENRSPTSLMFSTAPLLPLHANQEGGLKNKLKQAIKFRKKKGVLA